MWTPRDTKGSQGLRFPFFFLTVYYLSWDCHSVALFLIKHFWCKENIALSWYAVAEQIEKWVNGFQTDIKRKFLGRLCFIFLYRYDQVLNQPVSVFLFIQYLSVFLSLTHTHAHTHTLWKQHKPFEREGTYLELDLKLLLDHVHLWRQNSFCHIGSGDKQPTK